VSNVYLVTTGDGSDGDEWNVHGIFATKEAADNFACGASNILFYEVEEWGVHGSALSDSERDALATVDQLRIENAGLRSIVAGYTSGISASAESNRSCAHSDEKRGVADTDRATLTDAEREAILTAADLLIGSRPGATLRNLLERLK